MARTRNLGNLTNVLMAGTTYASGTTPPVGDNSTNLATTAYVANNRLDIIGDSRNALLSLPTGGATATFTADELIVGTAIGGTTYKLSSISAGINVAVAGAGGVDTLPVVVNGQLAVYVIYGTAGISTLGTNATTVKAPEVYSGTLPTGYTASALVAILPIGSSLIGGCLVTGRTVYKGGTIATGTSTTTSTAAVSTLSTVIPLNAKSVAGTLGWTNATAGIQNNLSISSTSGGLGTQGFNTISAAVSTSFGEVAVITPQTIWLAAYVSSASTINYTVNMSYFRF